MNKKQKSRSDKAGILGLLLMFGALWFLLGLYVGFTEGLEVGLDAVDSFSEKVTVEGDVIYDFNESLIVEYAMQELERRGEINETVS